MSAAAAALVPALPAPKGLAIAGSDLLTGARPVVADYPWKEISRVFVLDAKEWRKIDQDDMPSDGRPTDSVRRSPPDRPAAFGATSGPLAKAMTAEEWKQWAVGVSISGAESWFNEAGPAFYAWRASQQD